MLTNTIASVVSFTQKKKKKEIVTPKRTPAASPTKKGKKGKKDEVPEERWRWWEEEDREDGAKWQFLEHKGPVFAVDYDRLPKDVHFIYDGKPMKLSQDAEEVAGFFGRMIDHDYTTKKVFQDNFFKDWRKVQCTLVYIHSKTQTLFLVTYSRHF